jgi:hypothetical protein
MAPLSFQMSSMDDLVVHGVGFLHTTQRHGNRAGYMCGFAAC